MKFEELIRLIRERRKEKDLSQMQIAKQLNISQNMYSRYERMESEIPLSNFLKIAKILDIKIFKDVSLINEKDLDTIQEIVDRYRGKV